jgi:hypothetical protein
VIAIHPAPFIRRHSSGAIHSFIHSFIHAMIVIIRANHWELIGSPQTVAAAWRLADKPTAQTGVAHWVGRV